MAGYGPVQLREAREPIDSIATAIGSARKRRPGRRQPVAGRRSGSALPTPGAHLPQFGSVCRIPLPRAGRGSVQPRTSYVRAPVHQMRSRQSTIRLGERKYKGLDRHAHPRRARRAKPYPGGSSPDVQGCGEAADRVLGAARRAECSVANAARRNKCSETSIAKWRGVISSVRAGARPGRAGGGRPAGARQDVETQLERELQEVTSALDEAHVQLRLLARDGAAGFALRSLR